MCCNNKLLFCGTFFVTFIKTLNQGKFFFLFPFSELLFVSQNLLFLGMKAMKLILGSNYRKTIILLD